MLNQHKSSILLTSVLLLQWSILIGALPTKHIIGVTNHLFKHSDEIIKPGDCVQFINAGLANVSVEWDQVPVAAPSASSGVLAFWGFDEGISASGTAVDSVSHREAFLGSTKRVPSVLGSIGAVDLSSKSLKRNFVDLGSGMEIGDELSVVMVFKPSELSLTGHSTEQLFSQFNPLGGADVSIKIVSFSTDVDIVLWVNGAARAIRTITGEALSKWRSNTFLLVAQVSSTSSELEIFGTTSLASESKVCNELDFNECVSPATDGEVSTYLGWNPHVHSTPGFQGIIEEIAIFNRILEPEEVSRVITNFMEAKPSFFTAEEVHVSTGVLTPGQTSKTYCFEFSQPIELTGRHEYVEYKGFAEIAGKDRVGLGKEANKKKDHTFKATFHLGLSALEMKEDPIFHTPIVSPALNIHPQEEKEEAQDAPLPAKEEEEEEEEEEAAEAAQDLPELPTNLAQEIQHLVDEIILKPQQVQEIQEAHPMLDVQEVHKPQVHETEEVEESDDGEMSALLLHAAEKEQKMFPLDLKPVAAAHDLNEGESQSQSQPVQDPSQSQDEPAVQPTESKDEEEEEEEQEEESEQEEAGEEKEGEEKEGEEEGEEKEGEEEVSKSKTNNKAPSKPTEETDEAEKQEEDESGEVEVQQQQEAITLEAQNNEGPTSEDARKHRLIQLAVVAGLGSALVVVLGVVGAIAMKKFSHTGERQPLLVHMI